MNSQTGLDYIIENKEFTPKLATALDTNNVVVKKQVVELLSALCVYSQEGYERAISALQHYKEQKKLPNRFRLLIDEIQYSDDLSYKTALLAFCNCIIISTEKIEERGRIRNELTGQRFQDILTDLRKEAEKGTEADLSVQLEVYDEQKTNDEEQLPQVSTLDIDLGDPSAVFNSILKQVSSSTVESTFLSILQHLLQISDRKEENFTLKWETVEKLVYSASLLENKTEAEKLFHSGQKRVAKAIHGDEIDCKSPKVNKTTEFPETGEPIPPPPPPPGMPPPPPPPPPGGPPPPGPPGVPPPPPPPGGFSVKAAVKKLAQQLIPQPKAKTRKIQWQKIPTNKVIGKNNVWAKISNSKSKDNTVMLDFKNLEELFLIPDPTKTGKNETDGTQTLRKKKESDKINLLDNRVSLKVNIFLKQFRIPYSEIIQMLKDGKSKEIGAEKLRGLLKILPTPEDIEALNSHTGDKEKLASAEQFYLHLLQLDHYKLRVEIMVLKEEFLNTIGYISESVDTVIVTAQDLMESRYLQEILYMVLLAGNFLNSGAHVGDAAGIKLTSLLKLSELRSNKPRMNLLHVVLMQIENIKPELLQLPDTMKYLKQAAEVNLDALTGDIKSLHDNLKKLHQQLDKSSSELKKQFSSFIDAARKEVAHVEADMKDIEHIRKELAEYFAEDAKMFKLEECFTNMRTFMDRFRRGYQENKQREIVEKKNLQRQKEKQKLADQTSTNKNSSSTEKSTPTNRPLTQIGTTPADRGSTCTTSSEEDETQIVDNILGDIRSGFIQKKSFGDTAFQVTKVKKVNLNSSFSVPADQHKQHQEKMEDETLKQFDFLKTDEKVKEPVQKPVEKGAAKRTRSQPPAKNNIMDFLVATKEPDEKPFERKQSLRRRRGKHEVESDGETRDPSPAARSSDNEADVSGDSANNSLTRPNSKSNTNLHGLEDVSLPGQPDETTEESATVIVPTKYKPDEENSSFSRNNKLRTSFKDQFSKRFNSKNHGNISQVLNNLSEVNSAKKDEDKKKTESPSNKTKKGNLLKSRSSSTEKDRSKVLHRVNSISSEASNESELTAGLIASLRRGRDDLEDTSPTSTIQKTSRSSEVGSRSSEVGSRISNKFKNLYSTDDEEGAMFYQPSNKKKSRENRVDDNGCVDSGVEMNGGDTGSNRSSSTIEAIDLKLIGDSFNDKLDGSLNTTKASSCETITSEKQKRKSTTTATNKKTGAPIKKKAATTDGEKNLTKDRTKPKSSSTTTNSRPNSGVFDRLSTGRKSAVVRKASSRESVASHDSGPTKSRTGSMKSTESLKSSGSKTNVNSVDKTIKKSTSTKTPPVTKPTTPKSASSTSTVRRTPSSASKPPSGTPRSKTTRASTGSKPASTADKSTFLKKMLSNKAEA